MVTKIFGPPGTGKTHRCIQEVERLLRSGVRPARIAYLTFAKSAAAVAKSRAMEQFDLKDTDLPYFRTIHSLAFHRLHLRRDRVFHTQNLIELGKHLGLEFSGRRSTVEDGHQYGMSSHDRLAFLENLARIRGIPLRAAWDEADDPDIDWWELERYSRALRTHKANQGMLDFTDMLHEFVANAKYTVPALDALIIDEAQDMSAAQWGVADCLIAATPHTVLAGDDDQAVHSWAGADVGRFLNCPGGVQVLDRSYRVPRSVAQLAAGVAARISKRQPKIWHPREEPGSVSFINSIEESDLAAGEWLLLVRNGYMLPALEEYCTTSGYPFSSVGSTPMMSKSLPAIMTWESVRRGNLVTGAEMEVPLALIGRIPHREKKALISRPTPLGSADVAQWFPGGLPIWYEALDRINVREREFFLAARRRGEALNKKPRITISTIHAAKGGEADNVFLMTDVSQRSANADPDSEHRVFYVGLTRPRKNLCVVQPRTRIFYSI
jgi:superfamily I DNA/RNA helicase